MANSKHASSYWANYPATYRTEQVAHIMQWIAAGESGVVVGVSGTGKSNLAGFLSSRPDAIAPHIAGNPEQYCFLRLDFNSLPALTVPFFYRGFIQALQDASTEFDPHIQQALQSLTETQINWNDLFEVLTILQKAHHLVIQQAGKQVVWLLDRFDEACRQFDAQTLNSLRSLRDQFKGRLCYVIFTRQPLARLRDPAEIDEFHEIVARNICRLGPMVGRDARWIARRIEGRLQTTFVEQAVTRLVEITGGLPAFMKLACLALAEGVLSLDDSASIWVKQLQLRTEFQRNCQEIWDDLSSDERSVLSALSTGASERQLEQDTITYLKQTGLLVSDVNGGITTIFSPIFERFVIQQSGVVAGVIELHPKTRAVLCGGQPLSVELTSNEDRLLSFFLEHPGEICQKDALIHTVWPEEQVIEGIRDDRLAQLIKRLRQKIEPDPANPVYIQAVRGRGYRFEQPEG